ncbi:hypothetical protein [Flavisphingomonas formosensis]|uniref:hypothetical protein n=1 Tax=Flavisphingomonas formosensis TaxID=861534 RepID=UPI0012FCBF7E|nr:hypothetical protein [Sphingomonas formosensis]
MIHLTLAIVDFMVLLLKAALNLAAWMVAGIVCACLALWLGWRAVRKGRRGPDRS